MVAGQPRRADFPSILTHVHFYVEKEEILQASQKKADLIYKGHNIQLFQDLAPTTLRRLALLPVPADQVLLLQWCLGRDDERGGQIADAPGRGTTRSGFAQAAERVCWCGLELALVCALDTAAWDFLQVQGTCTLPRYTDETIWPSVTLVR
ncbi:hypothetical protein NDU88_004055 [Pleurodeles waltl]|uniref:Uncharacterized protein n=1 Tax=Pleurodeles waltl TaxID=8319 RepID=A0AAV7TQV8_PLEWA|nr:hypothetical protein NDU88_004055 [Pleurodeles waltl]